MDTKSGLRKSLRRIKSHLRKNWHSKRRSTRRMYKLDNPIYEEWSKSAPEWFDSMRGEQKNKTAQMHELLYIMQKRNPKKNLRHALGAQKIHRYL